MSSRKGKVARDREEKVAGDRESNREEKRGKNREERVLHALKRGEKTKSPIEKRKGEKK